MRKYNFAILLASMFLVAGCNGNETEHTFSDAWSSNATNHWHACNDSGCSETSGTAAHTFGWIVDIPTCFEAPGSKHEECSVCHYKKEAVEIPQLSHSYNSSDWEANATYHWHACTDEGYTLPEHGIDKAEHNWDGAYVEITPASYDSAQILERTCSDCGYHDRIEGEAKWEFGYETSWTSDATHHWHECTEAGMSGKEHGGGLATHNAQTISKVDPTATSVGHTEGTRCSVCDYLISGNLEIPMLNTTDYDVTVTSDSTGCFETWTLKDTSVLGNVQVKKQITHGVIAFNSDYYTSALFNSTFDGIEMSFDSATNTITLNVTKTGGVTLAKTIINVPNDNLVITGQPLIVEASATPADDGIKASSQKITIDNDTTLKITGHGAHNSKSGINCANLIVNEGASLKSRDFKYGLFLQSGGAINVNGSLSLAGTTYSSFGFTSRKLYFGAEHSLYKDDVFQIQDGTTPITTNDYQSKHLVITKDPNFVLSESSFVKIKTGPTDSTTGVAQVKCDICGATHDIELPKLTTTDYELGVSIGYQDGKVMQGDSYVWKNTSYGEIKGFTTATEIKSYIKIGNTYMNASMWSTKYPNATAAESGEETERVLTITLNGDTDFNLSDYHAADATSGNPIDLSSYKKVVVTGNGTLNIIYDVTSGGMNVTNFEIKENAVMNFKGAGRLTTSSSNCSKNYGMKIFGDVTISGTLTFDMLSAAIYADNSITSGINMTVTASGTLKTTAMSNAMYINSPLNYTSAGTTDVAVDPKAYTGYCFVAPNSTYTFTDSSETKLNGGYGIAGLAATSEVSIYIKDSSSFDCNNYNGTFIYYTNLIIGNGTDGLTQCDATVKLKRSNGAVIQARPVANQKGVTIINSSVEFVLAGSGSSNNPIIFYGSNAGSSHCFKVLSEMSITGCASLIKFDSNPVFGEGDFVTADISSNPTIKVDSACKNDFVGTVPENVPSSIAKRS